jgi:uncharacterized protein YndB with AHSA1/START domain
MDMTWNGSITINRSIQDVYTYLADFPRHAEWAQTVERLDLLREGDAHGIGTRYRTTERQAMQHDRRPFEPLTHGMAVVTICEVRELIPPRRIAWYAHTSPKALGLYADLSFDLESLADNSTRLTQHYVFHQPRLVVGMFTLIYGKDLDQKGYAQWQAGLNNIKLILEGSVSAARADSLAQRAIAR